MQLKKLTSLFLAVLLLISNFGLAFNVHYCGDKIASFSSAFNTLPKQFSQENPKKDCCCIKEGEKENSCCKNKIVDLKKDSKDVVVKTISFQIDAPFLLIKSSELLFEKAVKHLHKSNVTQYYCSPNAPPLFKLYNQYIFYA
ncbi:hypothetical protein [Flavobacterium sp.]|uniref:HYC_CC_PP family protein n=1 Tax=Flavobacterium sp. TaxID=239 RepID=UPI0026288DAE|nr:hypothetical protein [Flavobacterium sp.]MDD3004993.1 hypothetical protein [Flavobacterium sp.]